MNTCLDASSGIWLVDCIWPGGGYGAIGICWLLISGGGGAAAGIGGPGGGPPITGGAPTECGGGGAPIEGAGGPKTGLGSVAARCRGFNQRPRVMGGLLKPEL